MKWQAEEGVEGKVEKVPFIFYNSDDTLPQYYKFPVPHPRSTPLARSLSLSDT
jgi:hypothetical protein